MGKVACRQVKAAAEEAQVLEEPSHGSDGRIYYRGLNTYQYCLFWGFLMIFIV